MAMGRTKNFHMRRIRALLLFFMAALVVSGLTAIPLESGTAWLAQLTTHWTGPWHAWASLAAEAVADVADRYPFLLYGTDWLAFAHVVIALAFIGPLRDPVRNKWVVEWGLWCCVLVVVMAFTWAPFRDIPLFWRCVDAAFGVVGAMVLLPVMSDIRKLEGSNPITA